MEAGRVRVYVCGGGGVVRSMFAMGEGGMGAGRGCGKFVRMNQQLIFNVYRQRQRQEEENVFSINGVLWGGGGREKERLRERQRESERESLSK